MRRSSPHDVKAVEAFSENVSDWARYQNLGGEHDTVEKCPVAGTYDWRAYIQEETELARKREEQSKPREKKAERAEPAPVPAGYYA